MTRKSFEVDTSQVIEVNEDQRIGIGSFGYVFEISDTYIAKVCRAENMYRFSDRENLLAEYLGVILYDDALPIESGATVRIAESDYERPAIIKRKVTAGKRFQYNKIRPWWDNHDGNFGHCEKEERNYIIDPGVSDSMLEQWKKDPSDHKAILAKDRIWLVG